MKAVKKSPGVKVTDLRTQPGKSIKGGATNDFVFTKKVDKSSPSL